MHFAIVEDTESDRKTLQELIFANCSRHGETVEFSFYPSGEAFLEAFHPGLFSAVFMDIMLDRKGKNGMETAKELRKTALRLPIIFTTTEPEFSLEGYEVHPLDYLLKPVDPVKLDWCLQELREFWAVPLSFEFPESSGQETASSPRRVVLDDFCYAEKSGHWLLIHTAEDVFQTRLSLAELTALLPSTNRFFIAGKGLLLNFSQVKSIGKDGQVLLKDGTAVYCSRRKTKEVLEAYSSYLFEAIRKEF